MLEVLLVLHIVLAVAALFSRDLLAAAIYIATLSLLSALVFYMMDAPDVALTEAAVGAGLTTFVYVWAISQTDRRDSTCGLWRR